MSPRARRALEGAVEALPARDRALLALTRVEHLTPAQAAAVLHEEPARAVRRVRHLERTLRVVVMRAERGEEARWRA